MLAGGVWKMGPGTLTRSTTELGPTFVSAQPKIMMIIYLGQSSSRYNKEKKTAVSVFFKFRDVL